ncbi:TatD family hydrolase [Candidatus Peribacteria bacterium]|nr:TatD family hydrolase [Candidatus Peribacteria bacterium]
MFIDTHSHLYLGELKNHIPEAIENLHKNNFSHSIQVGTNIETSQISINLAKQYDILRATIGIHPCEAQNIPTEHIPEQLDILEGMIQKEQSYIVGFGEIGFDYYHLSDNVNEATIQRERQLEWFRAQIKLAKKYNLPVIIHTRNASQITLEELKKSEVKKFVIHCFSENWDFAKEILNMSQESKISFTGIVTYNKSDAIQEVAKRAPLNRIMIETDAPYLTPDPLRGKASFCEPYHTLYVFRKICTLRTEMPEIIEQELWKSSQNFFNL